MNSEYAFGNLRIHFESRARRRLFVVFFYAVPAAAELAGFFTGAKVAASAWINAGCLIFFVALWMVFTGIAGDMGARGDERETHRRDHAHFTASLQLCDVLAPFIAPIRNPNPLAPPPPVALRGILVQPNLLALSAFLFYLTLPQAIFAVDRGGHGGHDDSEPAPLERIDMAPRDIVVVLIYVGMAALMAGLWPMDHWHTTGAYMIFATLLANRLFLAGITLADW